MPAWLWNRFHATSTFGVAETPSVGYAREIGAATFGRSFALGASARVAGDKSTKGRISAVARKSLLDIVMTITLT